MNTNFIIQSITYSSVQHMFELDNDSLAQQGIIKMTVDEYPGFPCRVSLEDAKIGEEVLLFRYEHHKTDSPYQGAGPIFVRKNIKTAELKTNEVPTFLNHRQLSLRAYNEQAMMIDARTITGLDLKAILVNIFKNKNVEYIHIHNSGPGCYNCAVNRV